jgi:hypothetical protein
MASISLPTAVAIAGSVASVAAAGVGAMGAMQAGAAGKASADYQAQVASNNAKIAEQNAQYATAAGNAQATKARMEQSQRMGVMGPHSTSAPGRARWMRWIP